MLRSSDDRNKPAPLGEPPTSHETLAWRSAMAMRVSKSIVGVDVAKIELVTFQADLDLLLPIANEKSAIKRWLKTLPGATALAVEATNIYHIDLVEMAHESGFDVYIIDGFQLSNYRKASA